METLVNKITGLGFKAIYVNVVLVLGWIGAMKFPAYGAGAIKGLVASSPFISWLYSITYVQGAANFIGSITTFGIFLVTALLLIFALVWGVSHRYLA